MKAKQTLIGNYYIRVDEHDNAHLFKEPDIRVCSLSPLIDDAPPSLEAIENTFLEAMGKVPRDVVYAVAIHFSEAWNRTLLIRALED